jgi:peptidyl-prolyl cis-trans isomerase D
MIENIRKYTGLMIVVLVLLFIGLVFLGDGVGNSFSGKPVMKVNGRGISQKEFQRNAIDVQRIASELPMNGLLPRESRILASHYLGEDIIESPYVTSQSVIQQMGLFLDPNPTRLLANRVAIQKAGIEYGVTPSNEEVESFVENVIFADSEGNFDQEASREFFEEKAGKLGIGTRGFNEYIKDLLTAQNLFKLIGGDLAPEMETVRALYDSSQQKITVQQVSLTSAKFEAEVTPSEEEIKIFYEENQANYNSDEKRKVSYIFVEPDWQTKLTEVQKKKEEEAKKKAEEEAKLKQQEQEAKKAAEEANKNLPEEKAPSESAPETTQPSENTQKDPETPNTSEPPSGEQGQTGETGEAASESPSSEEQAPATPAAPIESEATIAQSPKDQLSALEKAEAVSALNPELTAFDDAIIDTMGKEFDKIAEQKGYQIVQTEFFTKGEAPDPFGTRVTNDAVGTLADAAFKLPAEGSSDEKITAPYQTVDGWFVIRLDEITPSQPLTFEEARSMVTADLKKKMARELLSSKSAQLHEKLAAAIKEGKSFTDVAKENEYEAVELPEVTRQSNSTTFTAAQYTNPGQLAPLKLDPTDESPDRALIILVNKREVLKDAAYSTGIENAFKRESDRTRYIAFQNWLYDEYTANKVQVAEAE